MTSLLLCILCQQPYLVQWSRERRGVLDKAGRWVWDWCKVCPAACPECRKEMLRKI